MAISLRSVGASPGANSSNCVITKPSGLAVGDFMLAHVVNKATSGTITPPANWTIVGAQSNTASSRSALFYKFAVQADVDATTFTFTLGTTGRNRGEMGAWLGVHTSTPIDVADQQINAAGTSIAVPTPTVTDGCTVLIIGSNAAGGTASACSGSDPTCTITLGYAVAYSTYCALACFSGVKSGTDAIDAHSTSTYTSAVSSGHAVALTPAPATYDLLPAEGNQTQGSDAPGLTQEHQLAAAEGYQTELSDSPALTQEHTLATAKGAQTQLSDSPVLACVHVLAADEGIQIQISDTPDLEQEAGAIDLIPAEGVQVEISDTPALSQVHNLIVAEGAQEQASDAPALTQTHVLQAAEGYQTQASDTPPLTQEHHLAAQEGVQVQVSDEATIDRIIVLMADEGTQEQLSDAATLYLTFILEVQKGYQTQFSDQATLSIEGEAINLLPAEGVQVQVSDSPIYLTIETGEVCTFPTFRGRVVKDVIRTGRGGVFIPGGRS